MESGVVIHLILAPLLLAEEAILMTLALKVRVSLCEKCNTQVNCYLSPKLEAPDGRVGGVLVHLPQVELKGKEC